MKKLLFTFAALLMAGSAMADRVVTFDAANENASLISAEADEEGAMYQTYQLSKDGVTITFNYYGEAELNQESWYYIPAGATVNVTSELYSVDEDLPEYERYYGGIRHIEFECMNGALTGPDNFYVELPNSYNDDYYTLGGTGYYHCYSEVGHCPQFVLFGNYGHVNVMKISVTLYGVPEVTPDDPVDPTEKTDAPSSSKDNYAYNDGNLSYNAYTVTFTETEPSDIYYRVGIMIDGEFVYGDWMLYTGELNFVDEGTYMIEAYAIAPGKTESDHIWDGFTVSKMVDVEELMAGKTVAGVRYFNVAGQEMAQPSGLTIMVTTFTDGTTSAVKVVK